jgi:hypothetical protein
VPSNRLNARVPSGVVCPKAKKGEGAHVHSGLSKSGTVECVLGAVLRTRETASSFSMLSSFVHVCHGLALNGQVSWDSDKGVLLTVLRFCYMCVRTNAPSAYGSI